MPIAVITGGNKGLGLSQSRRFLQAQKLFFYPHYPRK